ncbi:MAG: ABC transporter permease [Caldilineaceae bacterium SB0670_bin_27]|uniref:ABC transporter permease n=1 Tax=Caldilineaceae bacterium SB0664_bin_27 TaxID=2605260 RepID=A0A6B0YX94_9CHLR|nr:ABC transporter permease [Caldilineaceae bacterium SB0664_bin_27]MYJ76787.1 ABC transporter permease [Caldilineaceae bacterium SB0670_bin_27]
MIGTLVVNDIKLFFRHRFFAIVTAIGVVFYLVIYFLLPNQVDQSTGMAFFIEDREIPLYQRLVDEPGDYTIFDSEAEMLTALEETGDFFVGLSLPAELTAAAARGEKVELNAYYAPGVPAEAKQIFHDVLVLVANTVNPETLTDLTRFNDTQVVLGNDMTGAPLSMRDRFAPLLLMLIVVIEVFGLATLLNRDVDNGTARALVTGPLRLHQFFVGKALMGMALAFGQVLILSAVMGILGTAPLLLLATLLLGSFLMVGLGFFIAAISKDNTSVMGWTIVFIIPLMFPGFSILLPGLSTGWMEFIPSHYFVDSLHRIINFSAGWADVAGNLTLLLLVGAGSMAVGTAAIMRKF